MPPESQPNAPTGQNVVCAGPWEYRKECFKLSSTSACPQDGYYDMACMVDETCAYSRRTTETYSDRNATGEKKDIQFCDYSEQPPCETTTTSLYTKTCAVRATELIGELRAVGAEDPKFPLSIASATVTGSLVYGATQTTNSSGSGWSQKVTTTKWTQACTLVINNVATEWEEGPHPECGQVHSLCPDPSRPKYLYCRAPSHGLEPDPGTCDAVAGQGVKYSAPGLSQNTLKSTYDAQADIRTDTSFNRPRCLTADDVPYASVETKYTRLVTQLDAPVPAGVDGPALKFQLVNALKLLFELQANDPAFTPARRDRVLGLYSSHPEVNHFFRVDPTIDFRWVEDAPAAFMSPNTFSARWTGFVEAPQAGTYIFHVRWDDSVRLWVNGQLLVDRATYQGEIWVQGSISLTAGRHAVKLEHREGYGAAGVGLQWQPPGATAAQAIPTSRLFTPDQLGNGLLGEYFDNDDFTSDTCSTGLPPLEASCPAAQGVHGTLALCQRMLDTHLSGAAASSLLTVCTSAATGIEQLASSGCDTQAYWPVSNSVTSQLLIKGLPQMGTTLGSEARITELREKLASIQRWYAGLRGHPSPGTPPSPELMAQTSEVMKAFWTGAWLKDDLGLTATTDAQAQTVRAKLLLDGFTADRQVLLAAFGEGGAPPLTGAPLLYLLEDSLRALNERMQEVSRLHDMGCRFTTCTNRSTTTSQLWNVLAELEDAQKFQQKVSAATAVSADWKRVFNRMSTGHAAFRASVEDALGLAAGTYSPDDLFTRPVTGPAMALTAMLRDAQARADGYAASGLFTAEDDHTLKVGLNRQKQDEILIHLNSILQQLDGSVAAYNSNRLTLVQGLLAQLQNQGVQGSLDGKRLLLDEQLKALNRDLNGLRVGQAVEEARLGDFMDGFEALYPVIAEQGQVMLKANHDLVVPNTGRRGTDANDVNAMAALKQNGAPFVLSPSVGSQLVVQVGGRWSPTCALGLTAGPNGSLVKVTSSQLPITTGPEGFSVVDSAGTYTALAIDTVNTESNFSNSTNTESWCAGFNPSVPIFNLSGSVESCMSNETGTTWSRTWNRTNSHGSDRRSTFSVSRGLRSLLAPFPDEPVGSLLLVELVRGTTDRANVRSVRVLQSPSTALLVTAESDYYVVVNDAAIKAGTPTAQCSSWVGSSHLDVHIAQLSPQSNEAVILAGAMVSGLGKLKEEGKLYVDQGRLLPSQTNVLRNKAFKDMYDGCGCTSLDGYPESLRALFTTWVEKAVVDVEREVELVSIERQLRQLALEISALEAELSNAQTQSRLFALVPAWTLRNLDGTAIRAQLEALDEVLSQWLAPIVRILHPETLTRFDASELNLLNALTQIDPTSTSTDISVLAETAKQAARAVETRLRAVRVAKPTPTLLKAIVSIPRPGVTPTTLYKKVDPATAKAVWDEILAGRSPVLPVTPENVYNPGGGQEILPCNQVTPIIHSMAVYGVVGAGQAFESLTLTVAVSPQMAFPAVSHLYRYEFSEPTYLGPAVQMMFGPNTKVIADLEKYWIQQATSVGAGLSPFSNFQVALKVFSDTNPSPTPGVLNPSNPLSKVSELLIAFYVEPTQEALGVKLPGVLSCQ
ncbi:PA14 domain-containing protein [Corallococcus sp. CA053C]|uniref:PA14 domain-containing protein n=1 Tax=Corallococcus sp. CA053C TaxID=2316732 RepID=UPI00131542CC|nr:PA14 domain-containing protein [Corallococcus sp. CA053C]